MKLLIWLLVSFTVVCHAFTQGEANYYEKYYKGRRIIVLMYDGFGETYYRSTPLKSLNFIENEHFYKEVSALMPTVTNCNNVSICCGEFPDKTGITGNFFMDETGHQHYMESHDLVLTPTLFESLKAYGIKSALISSKKKTISLLDKGVEFTLSPEIADSSWMRKIGTPPPIYSREVNYWVMDAALYTLEHRKDISCLYIHTTDYPMHTWAPSDSSSIDHVRKIDTYIQKILEIDPEALVFITADHDVNHKNTCVDLQKSLAKSGITIAAAISAEKDKYLKHHRGFGGTSYVYLKKEQDLEEVKNGLEKIVVVKTVLTKEEACLTYHLLPSRVGDLVVFADSFRKGQFLTA